MLTKFFVLSLIIGVGVLGHQLDPVRWGHLGDIQPGWAQQFAHPVELTEQEKEYVQNQLKRKGKEDAYGQVSHENLQKKVHALPPHLRQLGERAINHLNQKKQLRRQSNSEEVNQQRFNSRQAVTSCEYSNLTVCDDPHIRDMYAAASIRWTQDVQTYVMTYDVIVLAEDDGSNPTATKEQIMQQNDILNSIFYNVTNMNTPRIQFNFTISAIHRTLLRYRQLLRGQCNNKEVLNDKIDDDCMSEITGFDAGKLVCEQQLTEESTCNEDCTDYQTILRRADCSCICRPEMARCNATKIANRYCDPECNWAQFNWDGGDCCPPPNAFNQNQAILSTMINRELTCRDPANPFVNYMDDDDFYFFLNPDRRDNRTVVYITPIAPDMLYRQGWAVQYREPRFLTNEAGVFVNSEGYYGVRNDVTPPRSGKTLPRLMAEVFGMLPVDEGVQGVMTSTSTKATICADPCYEPQTRGAIADVTGDLISDTWPGPRIWDDSCNRDAHGCGAPDSADIICEDCEGQGYKQTAAMNYMAFTGDKCKDHFTYQQVGRLYCYVDVYFRHWMIEGRTVPGPIIETPVATALNHTGTIWVTWVAPFVSGADPGVPLSYLMEREPKFSKTVLIPNGALEYTDKTIDPEEYYRYRVRALAAPGAGVWSAWSNWAGGLSKVCRCNDWNLGLTADADWHRVHGCSGKGK